MKNCYYKYTYIQTYYDYNFRKYACANIYKYIHTKNNGWSNNTDASIQGLMHPSAWALQGISESTTLLSSPPLHTEALHNLLLKFISGIKKWRDKGKELQAKDIK